MLSNKVWLLPLLFVFLSSAILGYNEYFQLFSYTIFLIVLLFFENARNHGKIYLSPWFYIFSFAYLYIIFALIPFLFYDQNISNVGDTRFNYQIVTSDDISVYISIYSTFLMGVLISMVLFINTKISNLKVSIPSYLLNFVLLIIVFRFFVIYLSFESNLSLFFLKLTEYAVPFYLFISLMSDSRMHKLILALIIAVYTLLFYYEVQSRSGILLLIILSGLVILFKTDVRRKTYSYINYSAFLIFIFIFLGAYRHSLLNGNLLLASNEFQTIFANFIDIKKYLSFSSEDMKNIFDLYNLAPFFINDSKVTLSELFVQYKGFEGEGIGYGFGLASQLYLLDNNFLVILLGFFLGCFYVLLIKAHYYYRSYFSLFICFTSFILVYHIYRSQYSHFYFIEIYRIIPFVFLLILINSFRIRTKM